jgi:hypothetical protein
VKEKKWDKDKKNERKGGREETGDEKGEKIKEEKDGLVSVFFRCI